MFYIIVKGGINGMIKVLVVEFGLKGVNVNVVVSGFFKIVLNEVVSQDLVLVVKLKVVSVLGCWGELEELVLVVLMLVLLVVFYLMG